MTTSLTRRDAGDPYTEPHTLQAAQIATAPASFPLRKVIEQYADVIGPLCPAGVTVESVIAQLYAAVLRTPQIAQATPQSLIIAITQAVQTGGIIGSDVYFLPFRNNGKTEVSFAFDYKFLASCIVQAGGARSIDAEVVRANDTFRVIKGTAPQIIHEPPPFGKDRGGIIGFYAVAHIGANVPAKSVVMSLAEVEVIRAKSKQWNKERVAICPDWYGMARVVHRLGALLPKRANPRLQMLEQIMDTDARVASAEEITPEPERPDHIDADGVDLSEDQGEVHEVDEVMVALDVALAMTVNKQVLGNARNSGLRKIKEWALGKIDAQGDYSGRLATIVAACSVILDARERGEIQEPAKQEAA